MCLQTLPPALDDGGSRKGSPQGDTKLISKMQALEGQCHQATVTLLSLPMASWCPQKLLRPTLASTHLMMEKGGFAKAAPHHTWLDISCPLAGLRARVPHFMRSWLDYQIFIEHFQWGTAGVTLAPGTHPYTIQAPRTPTHEPNPNLLLVPCIFLTHCSATSDGWPLTQRPPRM